MAMSKQQTVLLVGGTGRIGQRVLEQFLNRGIKVRVIVRSPQKLSENALNNPNLTVIDADLLSISDENLHFHVRDCDAVISCLGHVTSIQGVFGPPRDLVTRAMMMLCRALKALQPAKPVKLILLSSVSVNHPRGLDARRGRFEKGFVWILRGLIPPSKDNQQAANFLYDNIGTGNPFIQWAVIRPDTFREGDVSEYTLHEGLVSSLFAPDDTNMSNIAHFMCELVRDPKTWDDWKGKFPVIINAASKS
jgi:hypothetical protein